MEVYFAYGSNMSSNRLRARVPEARTIGRAHLNGWRLAFNKPGRDGTGKANLVASAHSTSWGALYEIPSEAWEQLDSFEPGYERARFGFERVSGSAIEAQALDKLRRSQKCLQLNGYLN